MGKVLCRAANLLLPPPPRFIRKGADFLDAAVHTVVHGRKQRSSRQQGTGGKAIMVDEDTWKKMVSLADENPKLQEELLRLQAQVVADARETETVKGELEQLRAQLCAANTAREHHVAEMKVAKEELGRKEADWKEEKAGLLRLNSVFLERTHEAQKASEALEEVKREATETKQQLKNLKKKQNTKMVLQIKGQKTVEDSDEVTTTRRDSRQSRPSLLELGVRRYSEFERLTTEEEENDIIAEVLSGVSPDVANLIQ